VQPLIPHNWAKDQANVGTTSNTPTFSGSGVVLCANPVVTSGYPRRCPKNFLTSLLSSAMHCAT
jgi:hypothetical protein